MKIVLVVSASIPLIYVGYRTKEDSDMRYAICYRLVV